MNLKKKIISLTLGFSLLLPVITVAQPVLVQSYIRQDFRLNVNGEDISSPEGLHPLIYQDRTYLPVSFIAQILGAEIAFNQNNKTIYISNDNKNSNNGVEDLKEKIEALKNEVEILQTKLDNYETKTLSRLPIRRSKDGYELQIEGLSVRDRGDGRLYVNLRNIEANSGVYISVLETTITIDGEVYKAQPTIQDTIDMDFYKWLYVDESINSYIPFANLPKESAINEMIIEIKVVTNQSNPKVETWQFEVLND